MNLIDTTRPLLVGWAEHLGKVILWRAPSNLISATMDFLFSLTILKSAKIAKPRHCVTPGMRRLYFLSSSLHESTCFSMAIIRAIMRMKEITAMIDNMEIFRFVYFGKRNSPGAEHSPRERRRGITSFRSAALTGNPSRKSLNSSGQKPCSLFRGQQHGRYLRISQYLFPF